MAENVVFHPNLELAIPCSFYIVLPYSLIFIILSNKTIDISY